MLPIMQAHEKELSRLGVEVAVYGVADDQSQMDRASWACARLRVHRSWLPRFAYAPGLDKSLTAASHDILHEHGLWMYPSIAVSRWRRRTARPVVISTQGMLEPWALANAHTKKRIAAWLFEHTNLKCASCIHCSEQEVSGVRAFGLTNPVAVIPNGVSLPDANRRFYRPQWLPQDGRRVLLFLGRLHPKKGIRETLDAWSLLTSQHPQLARQWRFVVAGWDDGGYAKRFIEHARALGLTDVLFPGGVYAEDKEATFANADAFILASHSEGLPMAVLEAWSHAIPVFMTRGCNLPEGFKAGAAIEIPTEPKILARVLAGSLHKTDLSTMGLRGRDIVKNHYAWGAIGANLATTYRWLTGELQRPSFVRLD
jgi:poly(glycerol-phosphate) alpha-glucosyltransferase